MTENSFIANGAEYDIDCMIFASGFEVTSDLDRRWGFDTFEGRNGLSIYDHWADGYKTLHGVMTNGFPNQFFIGYYQGGLNSTTTEQYHKQAQHITYIIKAALDRGATAVEPSRQAQDEWCRQIRATAIDLSQFQSECTPSYFNNEGEAQVNRKGEKTYRWYLGESYGPGWAAFESLLKNWRDKGNLEGLVVSTDGP
jgi:cyclohexanone monooxygenase